MTTKVNNYSFVDYANVLDSVTPTAHIVCNNYLSGSIPVRDTRPQTIISPESRPLDPSRVFNELGGFFF